MVPTRLTCKVTAIYYLQQADNFTNSLGVLQQFANPTKFEDFGNRPQQQQQQNEGELLNYLRTLFKLISYIFCVMFTKYVGRVKDPKNVQRDTYR